MRKVCKVLGARLLYLVKIICEPRYNITKTFPCRAFNKKKYIYILETIAKVHGLQNFASVDYGPSIKYVSGRFCSPLSLPVSTRNHFWFLLDPPPNSTPSKKESIPGVIEIVRYKTKSQIIEYETEWRYHGCITAVNLFHILPCVCLFFMSRSVRSTIHSLDSASHHYVNFEITLYRSC